MRNARNSEAAILLRRHERSIPYLVIFAFSNKGFLRRHIEKRKPQSPKIGSTRRRRVRRISALKCLFYQFSNKPTIESLPRLHDMPNDSACQLWILPELCNGNVH